MKTANCIGLSDDTVQEFVFVYVCEKYIYIYIYIYIYMTWMRFLSVTNNINLYQHIIFKYKIVEPFFFFFCK